MRSTIQRRILAIWTAIACVTLLAACGSGNTSGSGGQQGTQTLRIMTLNPIVSTDYLNLLADHLGLFAQNGIKAKFVSSADPISPLVAGDIDIANVGANGLIPVSQGRSLTFLASPMQHPSVALMVRRDSPLAAAAHRWPQAISQLKGLKVGTTTASGVIQQTAIYLATLANLTPGKDVTVVPAGNANTLVAGLERGDYDAGLVPSPLFETIQSQGRGVSLLDIYKGEGPGGDAFLIPWWTPAVTRDFYQNNPTVASGYQKSIQQALDYARDPAHEKDIEEFVAGRLNVDPKTLTTSINTFVQTLKPSGEYAQAQWTSALAMMQKNGVITRELSYADYVAPWNGGGPHT